MDFADQYEKTQKKLTELEEKRKKKVLKLLEKYCGLITEFDEFETYLKKYGSFIKKGQEEAKAKKQKEQG